MNAGEKLRVANQFMGYGEPNSSVWLIGNEEKLNKDSSWNENNLNEFKNTVYSGSMNLENALSNSTYGGYRRILESLFQKEYSEKKYFITNMWPFAKEGSSKEFDIDTITQFELAHLGSRKKILEFIKDKRFDALQMFFNIFNWSEKTILFCTGGTDKDFFLEFIKRLTYESEFEFDESHKDVWVNDKFKNIYWLNHASRNQIKDEAIEYIRNRLNSQK